MPIHEFIVIGIGKIGRDFINQLQEYNLSNISYLVIDFSTDLNPDEYTQLIRNNLAGKSVLFLFASTEDDREMSFGLIVSQIAREMGILNIATVLSYMGYDEDEDESGRKCKEFKAAVDVFMLLSYSEGEENDYRGLFYKGLCDRICRAVQGITYMFTKPGLKTFKFDEVKNFLHGIGAVECSTSQEKGSIANTALKAIDSIRGYEYGPVSINIIPALEYFREGPRLIYYSFSEAERVIIIIATGKNFALRDLYRAVQVTERSANPKNSNPNLRIIWGHVFDEKLKDDEVRITLISSFGFESPSGNYYETYEYMFMNESTKSICRMFMDNKISVYHTDKEFGITFMEAAARYGNAELMELCMNDFADADDPRMCSVILEGAIENNNPETLRVLIEHGITRSSLDETPAIMLALREDNKYGIVKFLIEYGCDVNASDSEDETPLMYAVRYSDPETVKLLIESGADVNARNEIDDTPLISAGASLIDDAEEIVKILRILIENGADVNAQNLKGENALMKILEGLYCVNDEMIRILIDSGINVNAEANDGSTALSIAIENHFELVKILLEAGADMNLLKTAYPIPNENENINLVRKVIRKRCKKFGLVPFDNFNEALDHNDVDKLTKAIENGLLISSSLAGSHSFIVGLRGMGLRGTASNIGNKALPAVIEIFYNALKEGRRNFLTKEYAKKYADKHEYVLIGLMHLAISDYDIEIVKILLKEFDSLMVICVSSQGYGERPLITMFPRSVSEYTYVPTHRTFNYNEGGQRTVWRLRTNYFPECNESDEARELHRKLNAGAKILKLLKEAGSEKVITHSGNDELTYVLNSDNQILNSTFAFEGDAVRLARAVSPEALKAVIASGVDVNDEFCDIGDEGITALELIVNDFKRYYRPDEMVRILLDAGADVKVLSRTWIQDIRFSDIEPGRTNMTQIRIIEAVMSSGKFEDIKQKYFRLIGGQIHIHMQQNIWNVIEKAFVPSNFAPYPESDAKLLAASCLGSIKDIQEYISQGADVNATTADGYTPLMYAAMFNTAEAVRLLIENGADVNAKDFQRQTALSLIVSKEGWPRNPDVIPEIVKGGADVNDYYDGDSTLLMIAARDCGFYDQGEIVAELINAGADVNAVRRDRKNALMLAYESGNFGTLRVLLASGADISDLLA